MTDRVQSIKAEQARRAARNARILTLGKTMTVSQVAEKIGVSRSTVGNVLGRHGVTGKALGRAPRVPGVTVSTAAPMAAVERPAVTLAPVAVRRIGIMRATAAPIDFSTMSPAARAILEAEPATCRFEVGGDAGFRFCGERATVAAGGRLTYCRACAPLVYPRMAQAAARGFPGRSDRSFAGA